MDGMPGDELMGSSNNKTSRAPAVTPSPPQRRSSSGSLPPPSNAFVHSSSSERWSQYERDSELEQDSARAHANAVASAAERAASLDTDSYSAGSSRRKSYNSAYSDLPPHERVRAEALAVLEKAGEDVSPYELRQTRSGGLTSGSKQPYSFRRSASSTRADDARATRADPTFFRSSDPDISSERTRRTRAPAALAGLDLKAATTPARSEARKWTISDDDDLGLDDEEDLVEVVDMENRMTRGLNSTSSSSSGYRDYPSQANTPPSNWSSRYNSVNPYLSGGVTAKDMQLDRDEQRNVKSARNMFMASTPPPAVSSNIFGSGFTFRKSNPPTPSRDVNLKTVWSDGDPLTEHGNSLDPPFYVGTNGVAKLRRRRRICVFSTIFALVMIAIIASSSKKARDRKSASSSVIGGSSSDGSGVGTTFYVMADVPYDADEGTKLSRDLEALPGDADFVIHLGNIQDATVSLCSEYGYEDAAAILQGSPAPVFMLPGENDWNNCPDPDKAWENWSTNFMKFERHFSPPFTVLRQSDQIENFSFLHDGVLFIGLHLVGGRVRDKVEWEDVLNANVGWVNENFNSIFKSEDYHAVVILGNARPSSQQRSFFNEIVQVIRTNGKPMIYIHANAEGSSKFAMYKPFGDAGNLDAVQLEDGGVSPPLRVSVGTGSQPFSLG
jgi:hypothetical protein